MTDKEFRHLSRADLVEIIYELQKSEKNMQDEIAELKRRLEDRRVAVERSGSLAEVLAKLNGLFEAAQATADDYRSEAGRLLEEARQTRAQADEYMSTIRAQVTKLARLSIQQRDEMLAKTEEECQRLRETAQTGQRAAEQGGNSHPIKEGRCDDDGKG